MMMNQLIESRNAIPADATIISVSCMFCTCSIYVLAYYETAAGDVDSAIVYKERLALSCKRGSESYENKENDLVHTVKNYLARVKAQMNLKWKLSYS